MVVNHFATRFNWGFTLSFWETFAAMLVLNLIGGAFKSSTSK